MSSAAALQKVHEDLQRSIETRFGRGYRVEQLKIMEDGHAGLTFGFDLVAPDALPREGLVLKLAPAGVRRSGNTDVYRQAPLLEALHAAGAPVPSIRFAAADEVELGVPFIAMERLPGRTFVVWEPHESFDRAPAKVAPLWVQAARALAEIHKLDWTRHLADWEKPRSLTAELTTWDKVLGHATEADRLDAGRRLGAALRASIPKRPLVGLVHGDFQPGNVLYENGLLTGVIDWELAHIGSQALDVGWLMMTADPSWWHESWQPVVPLAEDQLVEIYRAAGGPATSDIGWHKALSAYRLGSIACLNVKLHRAGKRTDDMWERFAPSIATLFGGALDLLSREHR